MTVERDVVLAGDDAPGRSGEAPGRTGEAPGKPRSADSVGSSTETGESADELPEHLPVSTPAPATAVSLIGAPLLAAALLLRRRELDLDES